MSDCTDQVLDNFIEAFTKYFITLATTYFLI